MLIRTDHLERIYNNLLGLGLEGAALVAKMIPLDLSLLLDAGARLRAQLADS